MKKNIFIAIVILIFFTCNVHAASTNWKMTILNCIDKNNKTVSVSIGNESKKSLDAFIKKSCIDKLVLVGKAWIIKDNIA